MSDGLPPRPGSEEERRLIEERLKEQENELLAEALRIKERDQREREIAEKREEERQKELLAEAQRIKERDQREREIAEQREKERQAELLAFARRIAIRDAVERETALRREAEREVELRRHAVSLQVTGEGVRTDTVDPPKPEIFYVIVGRGPAAVINHTTLRQSVWGQKRIGALRVMHIGFLNPWAYFMEHGMGQPPYLLSMPGFTDPPANRTVDGGLKSTEFAGMVDREFERLREAYAGRIEINRGWVVYIQTGPQVALPGPQREALEKEGMSSALLGRIETKLNEKWANPEASLRVLVMAAKPLEDIVPSSDLSLVYAHYVDICTGAGRPNVAPLPGAPPVYENARTKPWLPAEVWGRELLERKIMNAVDSIRNETPWTKGERVCVTAGGGVGLNAAEKSTLEEAWLDWFGRDSLVATFNNPRNDTILRHPREDRRLEPGESDTENLKAPEKLIPFAARSRFGNGASLDSVAVGAPLTVKVKASSRTPPKIRDSRREESGLHRDGYWELSDWYGVAFTKPASATYDRLILPNGQGFNEPGQPKHIAARLGLEPLLAADGRMLVLGAVEERVRVMGAAAQNLGDEHITASAASRAMVTYRTSMAVSAVPDGFILSGANIANANHFFDETPNKNVNTVTQTELEKLLTVATCADPKALAAAIVDGRKGPKNNGFATMDKVIELLRGKSLLGGDEDKIRGALRTNYEPSTERNLLPALTLI